MRLVLASASPRRSELLTAAGFSFEILVADVDETAHPGEAPREYVRRLAREKAAASLARLNSGAEPAVVLGADTTVVVDGEILGKPVDLADAERMLRLLSGRSHTVLTGVAVTTIDAHADTVVETEVFVNALSNEQVAWYVGSGEGADKAGAYAIQGLASRFITRIDGSYSNVVGLPVAAVDELIRTVVGRSGVLASSIASELF
ncbi:MAG: Maf family protein [Vicinamibacterales bacterium]